MSRNSPVLIAVLSVMIGLLYQSYPSLFPYEPNISFQKNEYGTFLSTKKAETVIHKASKKRISFNSGIFINEVMASNDTTILDANGNASDWFEIFNNTSQTIDLANFYVTDDPSNLKKFRFTDQAGQVQIPAFGYKIIWAGSEANSLFNNTTFSLSANGEYIGLVAPDGVTLIDGFSFNKQYKDVSFGRLFENSDSLAYFSPATPNAQNVSQSAFLGVLEPPTFSQNGGYFSNSFDLNLSHSTADIYYTFDSSEPDSNHSNPKSYTFKNYYPQDLGDDLYDLESRNLQSFKYTSALSIEDPSGDPNNISRLSLHNFRHPFQPTAVIPKAKVVRARAFKPGYLSSDIVTQTYFFTSDGLNPHQIPVFSLSTSEENLYQYETGIGTAGQTYDNTFLSFGRVTEAGNFANSGKLWERAANFEAFEGNLQKVNQNIDLRVHGKASRQSAKKPFRIYLEEKAALYPNDLTLFTTKTTIKNPGTYPRHDISSKIPKGLNFNVQTSYPSLMYLNGEYWGIYNLNEYFDDDYLASKYNLEATNLDIYKDELLDEGDDQDYNKLMAFLDSKNTLTAADYDSLKSYIDIDNFTDYFISEIFLNNTDWPYNNTFMWRNKKERNTNTENSYSDGRWRCEMVDLDYTLQSPQENGISYPIGSSGTTKIYTKLIFCPEFKKLFINRYADLLNTYFNSNRTSGILADVKSLYVPELPDEILRWEGADVSTWNFHLGIMNDFLLQRPAYIRNNIKSFFNLNGSFDLSVKSSDLNQGYVKVNSIDINSTTPGVTIDVNNTWTGTYFKNVEFNITAKSMTGYRFSHWLIDGVINTDSVLTINSSMNMFCEAFFESNILSDNPIPEAYVLRNCTYSLSEWSKSAVANTSPKNMKFVYFVNRDPLLNENIQGFTSGGFNSSSKSRINGLDNLGISFINTGSNAPYNTGYGDGTLGGALLAINTTNADSILVSWTGRTIKAGTRKYALRLQYRVGDIQTFNDFSPVIEYTGSSTDGSYQEFHSIKLPSEILNKPYVQLLWRYYYTESGSSGSRDQLAIDDILVKVKVNENSIFSNQTMGIDNPANLYLKLKASNGSKISSSASESILLRPGFIVDQGNVFEAKIVGCENN
jgi:hypothetical protein